MTKTHKVHPPEFTHDGGFTNPPDTSEKNTRLVIEHCKAIIKYLAFLLNKNKK